MTTNDQASLLVKEETPFRNRQKKELTCGQISGTIILAKASRNQRKSRPYYPGNSVVTRANYLPSRAIF
jgi:hypothetical protein